MTVSAKTEYACLAMLELAAHFGRGEPLRIRQIAEKHGIPSRFLVQILIQLRNAGLVVSTRGATGGYQLARDPRTISLAEVVNVAEGVSETTSVAAPDSPFRGVLIALWNEAARQRQQLLESVSLAELVDRASRSPQPMYYI
ncbi:MAG: Rrf2 family transcriptional regulator [Pirellulaceae bacterium]|nr:MAG: Rrf2 family transcriptional regulator [Pirellulaceae bacterium]